MTTDGSTAIKAFERLGLTNFQAQVFIGLHRLGSGTARDVAAVTDVPRSQVMTAAEQLEAQGLVSVLDSTPRRFRAIDGDQARAILRDRFETQQDRAFDYVQAVQGVDSNEEPGMFMTVRGLDRIGSRVVDLIMTAEDRIVIALEDQSFLTDQIERAIHDRAGGEIRIRVVSTDETVRGCFDQHAAVTTVLPPTVIRQDDSSRLLFVDDDGLLMAVVEDSGNETAIWSSGSSLGSVFNRLIPSGGVFGEDAAENDE